MAIGKLATSLTSQGHDSPAPAHVLHAVEGQPLTIPGGAWLLKADFVRQGSDLVLRGQDGKEILVRDYFSSDTPPDLVTEGGAVIQGDLAERLAGPLAPGQYAQATPHAPAEVIGRAETVKGTVEVTHADGTKGVLAKNDPLHQGDVLSTTGDGSVGIVFTDNTVLSLGANGRITLDEVVYDPTTKVGSFNASVVQGVFSFTSGEIAKTGMDAMTIRTPVASIGIRGTTVVGEAAAEGETNTVSLLPDSDGHVGEIAVSNSGGTQILSQPGATTQVTSFFQAPPTPVNLPIQQIQQQYSSALTSLPPQPAPQNQTTTDQGKADQGGKEGGKDGEGKEGGQEEAAAKEGEGKEGGKEGEGKEGGKEGELKEGGKEGELKEGGKEGDLKEGGKEGEGRGGPPLGPDGKPLAAGDGPPGGPGDAPLTAGETGGGPPLGTEGRPVGEGQPVVQRDAPPPNPGSGNLFGPGPGTPFGPASGNIFGSAGDGNVAGTGGETVVGTGGGDRLNFGGGDLFGTGGGDIFGLGGGNIFAPGGGETRFGDETRDTYTPPPPSNIVTIFDAVLLGTAGNDNLNGPPDSNANFYFGSTGRAGTDTVTSSGVRSQVSFDNLNNVKIKLAMNAIPNDGVISIWNTPTATETPGAEANVITFHNVSQYMFASVPVPAMLTGYVGGTSTSGSGTPPADGDVIIFGEGMGINKVGYVLVGDGTAAETFTLSSAVAVQPATQDGVLIFGKGGGDTFNIDTLGHHMIIGGATGSDNQNAGSLGYPNGVTVNTFSYATGQTSGINVSMVSSGNGLMGGDAYVANSAFTLTDKLWDVGSLTTTGYDDSIDVFGGAYNTISTGAGDDTIRLFGTDTKISAINGGTASGSGDTVALHLYSPLLTSGDMPALTSVETLTLESMTSSAVTVSSLNTTDAALTSINVSLDYGGSLTITAMPNSVTSVKAASGPNATTHGDLTVDVTTHATALGITGGYGDDTLKGGAAGDIITFGAGTDSVYGSGTAASDTFWYSTKDSFGANYADTAVDTIYDFERTVDVLQFDNSVLRGAGNSFVTISAGSSLASGNSVVALNYNTSYADWQSAAAAAITNTNGSGTFALLYKNSSDGGKVHVALVDAGANSTFSTADTGTDADTGRDIYVLNNITDLVGTAWTVGETAVV